MSLSTEGFSLEGFNIDAISDITGIGMNRTRNFDTGSQHSGSFGSDNTDALLSVSFGEFDIDELHFESNSPTLNEMEAYGTAFKVSSSVAEPHVSFSEHSSLASNSFSMHTGMAEVSFAQNKNSASFDQENASMPQSLKQSKQFKNLNVGGLKTEASYVPRKLSSDSELTTINGRNSVIRLHSSLPNVNSDFEIKTSDLGERTSRFVNGDGQRNLSLGSRIDSVDQRSKGYRDSLEQRQIDERLSNSHSFNHDKRPLASCTVSHEVNNEKFSERKLNDSPENGSVQWGENSPIRDITKDVSGHVGAPMYSLAHDNMTMYNADPNRTRLYYDEHQVRSGSSREHQTVNSNGQDFKNAHEHWDTIVDNVGEHCTMRGISTTKQSGDEHLENSYEKFERKGAAMSLHNGNFDGMTKSKNRSQNSQREEFLLNDQETSDLYNDDKVRQGAELLSRVLGGEYDKSFNSQRSNEKNQNLKSGLFKEKESLTSPRSFNSSMEKESNLPRSSSPKKERNISPIFPGKSTTPGEKRIKSFSEPRQSETAELKNLELDIEDILSRKRMAMHELQTIEDSLQRNKADMKSSQSLVEQYRWQATQARSELMNLEKRRSLLLEECNSMDEALQNSKLKYERNSHIESLQEKLQREVAQWKRSSENADLRIKQLEASLLERNDEIRNIRASVRDEKQKSLDIEKKWRSQLESERQDGDIKYDEQERSWKNREEKTSHQLKHLENLVEERTLDLRRAEERCRSQTEELQKIIESKNEEIKMVRGLVRQQEDATRILGERLRQEAREHVRDAVEKECESLHLEKERVKRTLDEETERHDKIVKQLTEQLDIEKKRHLQSSRLKQEEKFQSLQRKYDEDIKKLKDEMKKEQLTYRKTISKLEQEFQKLVATKKCNAKRDAFSCDSVIASNGLTQSQSPALNSRSAEKSSSADLLKHLQDRVKKLRAENENLKKTSDRESLTKNTHSGNTLDDSENDLFQTKSLSISQLRTPAKDFSRMTNDSIEQVSRIQRLLAGSTQDSSSVRQNSVD